MESFETSHRLGVGLTHGLPHGAESDVGRRERLRRANLFASVSRNAQRKVGLHEAFAPCRAEFYVHEKQIPLAEVHTP